MKSSNHLLQKLPVDLAELPIRNWDELFSHLGLSPSVKNMVFDGVYYLGAGKLADIPGITDDAQKKLEPYTVIRQAKRDRLTKSADGSYKLTLSLFDGYLTETVIIPEWNGDSLRKCSVSISSQIGCFFGCSFCATGKMGFHRNLSTGELIAQVREAEQVIREELDTKPTHLYFMGMGEPMHNYRAISDALTIMQDEAAPGPAPERTTVSTVGLYRQIRMLADDHPRVKLAVSVHSADQQTRFQIMPVSARLALPEIRDAVIYHSRQTGHPATIQYLLLNDVNDRPEDAENLTAYLDGLNVSVTLIMYNAVPKTEAHRTELKKLENFAEILTHSGLPVDIRWCYGEDIDAGCGQLKQVCSREDRVSMSMRHQTDTASSH